jgi:hypothetical protein
MNHHYPMPPDCDPMAPRLADALRDPRVAFVVAAEWELSDAECAKLLGFTPQVVWYWERSAAVVFDPATFARAAYLVGIHRYAHSTKSVDMREFVRRRMNLRRFPGKSIIEILMSGSVSDMESICRYLGEPYW